MRDEPKTIYYPEPEIDDPTYCKRDEHILDWLLRSTIQRAVDYRKILNTHLLIVPKKTRDYFFNASRDHWNSAVFEVIIARFLQELGAHLEVEQEISGGTRPDFLATFSEVSIIVEATVPEINADIKKIEKQRNPLLKIIESKTPCGWDVYVSQLPKIGLSDSKKDFSHTIEDIFSEIDALVDQSTLEITRHLASGDIVLFLTKRNKSSGIIAFEPILNVWDNSELKIKTALDNKKSQVKTANLPVILAINALGIVSEWEDFDKALFGYTAEKVDLDLQIIGNEFHMDGYLLKHQRGKPIYAGVLAFVNVGIPYGKDPLLYRNPYFKGKLPSAIESLQQRCFDLDSKEIYSKQSENPNILESIRIDALDSKN